MLSPGERVPAWTGSNVFWPSVLECLALGMVLLHLQPLHTLLQWLAMHAGISKHTKPAASWEAVCLCAMLESAAELLQAAPQ